MLRISIFSKKVFTIILISSVVIDAIEAGSTPVVLWHGMGKKNKLNTSSICP